MPTITWLSSAPLIADGAWGTQLQARGLVPGACPDAWNLERPSDVVAVAASYVQAGARVVLTNTFGANRVVLERHGLSGRVAELNRRGVELSRQGGAERVVASIGPCGRVLVAGEISEADLVAAIAEQAEALAAGGADALVVETQSCAEEAALAVAAAARTGLPVICAFAFGCGRDGDRTMHGLTPERAVRAALDAGAALAGANCGLTPARLLPVARRLAEAAGGRVWLKPNAGQPELVAGAARWLTGPETFAAEAAALRPFAAVLGGCCGSDPACIAALAASRLAQAAAR
jgi:methionine synthase I (cobalamin-dependent)